MMYKREDIREFNRIYAKVINYKMEYGKADFLMISRDTFENYSTELQEEIMRLGIRVYLAQKPNVLKVCDFESFLSRED